MNFPDLFSFRSYKISNIFIIIATLFIVAVVFIYAYNFGFLFPPANERVVVNIPRGATANEIAELLMTRKVIRSGDSFLLYVKLFGDDKVFRPGVFVFTGTYSVPDIIHELQRPASTRSITLLEGWTVEEMGQYFEKEGIFQADEFIRAAEGYEGSLFPDTYEIYLDASSEEVVEMLRQTFQERIARYDDLIRASGRSLDDIIIMASIIEREAQRADERHIISGILWKRLDNNMPLQVDATLTYVTGRGTRLLTTNDLNLDSPYNTYKYSGLPVRPIANPGISAIEAALMPEESPYWYYLHDREGNPHYSVTFEEHKENKFRYLR